MEHVYAYDPEIPLVGTDPREACVCASETKMFSSELLVVETYGKHLKCL